MPGLRHHIGQAIQPLNNSAKAMTTIRPAISNSETVAAIVFAFGLSFHDRRRRFIAAFFAFSLI